MKNQVKILNGSPSFFAQTWTFYNLNEGFLDDGVGLDDMDFLESESCLDDGVGLDDETKFDPPRLSLAQFMEQKVRM